MKRRITDDRIAKLAPKPKQYALTIPSAPGLQIRVSPGGRKAWSLRYQDVDGKQKRRTLGTFPEMSLSEAETAVKTPQESSRVLTLEELVKDYLKRWAKPRRATWREDERVLTGRVLDHFGKRTLVATIRRRDLATWLDTMVEEELNAAVARYYGHFRRCLRWAVEVDILDADPTTGVRLPVKEAARERLITDDEIRMLWHGLKVRSVSAQRAVRLCLATGLRIGEVVSARWEHVGPDVWTVPATATKAKRQHLVPVSRFLRSLLDDLPSGAGFLFNSPTAASGHLRAQSVGKTISREFPQLVGDLRIHDARRLVGTWMARNGIAPEVISAVLGHAPAGVTAVHYIHAEAMLPRQSAALESWQKHLGTATKTRC